MDRYDFITADGSAITSLSASSTTIATNMFLGRFGRAARAQGNAEWSFGPDVIATRNGKVVAVLSDRGKRRPDVMILDYMRAQILAG